MKKYVDNYVHNEGIYSDILDGEVYRRQSQVAKADGSFCISLYWHSDGAPGLKSKNMSLWPIQSFIAEMPPHLRYSFKNILLSGLWYGMKKPEMKVFQNYFVEQVKTLQDGFWLELDGNQTKFKLVIGGQAADLVAKAPSINCKLHNGKFGCSICLHAGRRLPGRGNKRVYEYCPNVPPRRNHDEFLLHANLAQQSGEAIYGVKGTSPVHDILQIPEMLLLDYMHQVLEGEYTRRLSKWLSRSCPSGVTRLSNGETKKAFSKKLLSTSLPHDFKRKLRQIEEFKKWKASEKQTLFLHVGLPLLKQLLPSELFHHHCLLVTGIRLLCEDDITETNISIAEAMLQSYTRLLPSLFDVSEATYNSHALTHLPQQVRSHGPLILHSAFVFESMLAHLKRKFHGTRGIPDQIIKKLALAQHSTGHILKNIHNNNNVKELAEKLLKPEDSKSVVELNDGIKFIPPLQQQVPEVQHPIQNFPVHTQGVAVSQRMIKDGQVYHSSHYSRKKKSCSFLVQFNDDGLMYFGKVEYFVRDGADGFAVVNLFRNLQFNVSEKHITQPEDPVIKEFWSAGYLGCHFTAVQKTQQYKYIHCSCIQHRIVFVESEDQDVDGYVSTVLKSYQHD